MESVWLAVCFSVEVRSVSFNVLDRCAADMLVPKAGNPVEPP